MKRIVLALIVCPVVAAGQKPESRWSFEVATTLTAARSPNIQAFDSTLYPLVQRGYSQRFSVLASASWSPINTSATIDDLGLAGALPAGIAAARKAVEVGPYTSMRASAYILGTGQGVLRGGYAGVGYARPTSFGGIAFEIGVHGYSLESQYSWWRL